MAKRGDKRIDSFRDEAMVLITEKFSDMKKAYEFYMSDTRYYDKGVSLYMKLVDKVIPALQTQAAEAGGSEKPEWMQKIDKTKKTYESDTK